MIEELTIYLCGPINGRTDAECLEWRRDVVSRWPGKCLDPTRRDYRGNELSDVAELVRADLADINTSHGVLVMYDRPSVGTSMEIFYAKHIRKLPIVIIDEHNAGHNNPWLVFHSDGIVRSIDAGLREMAHQLSRHAR